MNRRTRTLAGLVALATAASATLATGASAAPPPDTPSGVPHEVTLLTGDKVSAKQGADGRWRLSVTPVADGKPFAYQQIPVTRDGRTDLYLVPEKAAALVAAGALDRELFNVTGLIRQGYDDARSKVLPLLVEYPEAAATRRAARLRGASVRRELPEQHLASVDADKTTATAFWRELTDEGPATLSGGSRKIWLNGKVQASLEQSVPQVGAPAAWQAGFTGKGVTVAVLDTGIDEAHPDLAGKTKHRKDFSGKGSVVDGDGHGTHVAATVAGTGAGAAGKTKGVAPEADLAIGKVLDDGGSGQFDDIIAGMAWAAGEAKAKVISMSLGGGPSDGTDPVSQAVNTLSRKHGALFVIAAGNFGSPGSVSNPGTADLALTVASVTKSGGRSDFSSQGPRYKDGAVKPEIAAPGSDIVAARAKDTAMGEPVNDLYTKASGTSMATPHVAGGAAILAQQHPEWTGEQLKSALVGSTKPVQGSGAFAVGSGSMDLAKAVASTIAVAPSVTNTFLKWPSTKAETRVVSYSNPGNAPVELDLALDLPGAPAGLAKLSATKVTVPAKGKADVTLTLTPRSGKPGAYGGVLTATGGGTTVRSLVGVNDEPESYDVTAKATLADGKPAAAANGGFSLYSHTDGELYDVRYGESVRVPKGEYTAIGSVRTPQAGKDDLITTVANPLVKVGRASTVSFDARQGRKVKLDTEQAAARGGYWTSRMQYKRPNAEYAYGFLYMLEPRFAELTSYSTPGVRSPGFVYANNLRLEEPDLELWAEGANRNELNAGWLRGSPEPIGQSRYRTVWAGEGTPEELAGVDAKGKLVAISLPGQTTYDEVYKRIENIKAAGGVAAGLVVAEDLGGVTKAAEDPLAALPSVRVFGGHAARFAEHTKAGGELSLTTRNGSRYRYELSEASQGKVPGKLERRYRDSELAAVTMAYHGYPATEPPIVGSYVDGPNGPLGTQWHNGAVPSGERVEHFTPGNWEINVSHWWGASGDLTGRIGLEAGKTYRQEWNRAVIGPSFAGTHTTALGKNHPYAWANAEVIDVTVPWFADAAGHPRLPDPRWGVDSGGIALYGDDKEIGRHSTPSRGLFTRSPAQQYRLEADITRDVAWWPVSTKISGKWTFAAPRERVATLPLLSVRYTPPVDLKNLSPAGKEVVVPVSVSLPSGPVRATSLTVDYSTDDGATWRAAEVARTEAGWTATVPNPASGAVSLRAKASDGSSSVEQTIVKAYQVG
ncbi:subtilisin family serine protease [Crossiella equi]|uniref:Subtilisin family serine protease n=1 Tax=Crossiella equi TaxID=130796 RepID=A0ABS5AC02_9PSEU|nr:S8 family serine peptidase [Crossiella equi]MBP2473724.1 subtilisin family serine protease [Crossiella equi]